MVHNMLSTTSYIFSCHATPIKFSRIESVYVWLWYFKEIITNEYICEDLCLKDMFHELASHTFVEYTLIARILICAATLISSYMLCGFILILHAPVKFRVKSLQ